MRSSQATLYPSLREVSNVLATLDQHLFALEPQYRERVWGGQKLHPADPPIGEAWIGYGPSRVVNGPLAGSTIDELTAAYGSELVGATVAARFGNHFPILAKLLDCADWLSVQVHPNDEQARRMVGPEEFGKTEAWYFIEAQPGARIMAGVKPDVDGEMLAAAIRENHVLELADYVSVHAGEAFLVPAGTLHALGPGLLLYEIQEASDTTYRVYDWDRPQSAGRKLHIEESVAVTLPVGPAPLRHPHLSGETGAANALNCKYFDLELVRVSAAGPPFAADTAGGSFHLLTVLEGIAEIGRGTERLALRRFETAMVASSVGRYEVRAGGGPVTLLRASVPD